MSKAFCGSEKVTWVRGYFIRPWATDLIFGEPIGRAQPQGRAPPVMNAHFGQDGCQSQ